MANVKPFVLPDAKSWLARIYIYGLRSTSTNISEHENLCHFTQVIFAGLVEGLYLVKRGWKGIFRPFQIVSILMMVAVLGSALFFEKTTFPVVVGVSLYGLFSLFGTTIILGEYLAEGDGEDRFLLIISWLWGGLVLLVAGFIMIGIAFFESGQQKIADRPQRAVEEKPRKVSKTLEFIATLYRGFHARVCLPVAFGFDLKKAVWGRKETVWCDAPKEANE